MMTVNNAVLYNEERKMEFLERYELDGTKETVKRIFKYSANIENQLDKDLCDFNLNEVEELMYGLSPMSFASSRNNASYINAYIVWCISNGRSTSNNFSPLHGRTLAYYKQFVDFSSKIYFSKTELEEDIIGNSVNYQDKAFMQLLFEGAFGHQLSEILNITKDDVNYDTNEIVLKDSAFDEPRTLTFSDKCMQYVSMAFNQKTFQMKNGRSNRANATTEVLDTDYLIRNLKHSRTRFNEENEPADRHIFYRRFDDLKKFFDMPFLNAKSTQQSGMIYKMYEEYQKHGDVVFDEKGILKNEYMDVILERFGIGRNKKYQQRMAYRAYLNREIMEQLYSEIDTEDDNHNQS